MNHIESEEPFKPIEVSAELDDFCNEFKNSEKLIGVYHVNAINKEGVQIAFLNMIKNLVDDYELNQRTLSMKDDFWDDSIKIRKRKITMGE